ncbi:FeoB-associated Cys-rich membrane protein [Clostridium sp. OF09-36]|nr:MULTISPECIES: FeoB-associated Cys-rich membrane protein [unclassified Clostridium]RHS88742.1 FeoB-associated Cys-rich membrane protein [Clostridium sp. AM42-4]RHV89840.1 FeoB-associated Cys-rich membrane protein [Clostridium sp. OF09-36]HBM46910.1 FeoB-associated Cys-rich membrane protein [Lachnoclostridium sp.]
MLADIIVVAVIAGYCFYVIRKRHQQKKSGGCSGSCAGCSGCASCHPSTPEPKTK